MRRIARRPRPCPLPCPLLAPRAGCGTDGQARFAACRGRGRRGERGGRQSPAAPRQGPAFRGRCCPPKAARPASSLAPRRSGLVHAHGDGRTRSLTTSGARPERSSPLVADFEARSDYAPCKPWPKHRETLCIRLARVRWGCQKAGMETRLKALSVHLLTASGAVFRCWPCWQLRMEDGR